MNYSLNFHDYLNKISKAGGAFHSKSQQIFRSRGASRPTRPPLCTPLGVRGSMGSTEVSLFPPWYTLTSYIIQIRKSWNIPTIRARRFREKWNRKPNRNRKILTFRNRNRNRNREIKDNGTGTGTVGTEKLFNDN
jgi:hypothetical protein